MYASSHGLIFILSLCLLNVFPTAIVSAASIREPNTLEVPQNFKEDLDQLPIDGLDVKVLRSFLSEPSDTDPESQKVFPYFGKAEQRRPRTDPDLSFYNTQDNNESTEENSINYNWQEDADKTTGIKRSNRIRAYLPEGTKRAVELLLKNRSFKNIPLKKTLPRRPTVKRWWAAYYRPRPQMDRRAAQSKHYGCLKRCIDAGKLHPIQCHTLC